MNMLEIIKTKRDKLVLSKEQIDFFIDGVTKETIPDYQISALLMAIFLNGMNHEETVLLTDAMMHSGDVVDLSYIPGIKVDKHSTGGVGDKTSIVLIPLLSSLGVTMAKMSGRGLGHTGGTIDKLESIPGFRTDLTKEEFKKQVQELGLAIIASTSDVAPADKALYALRDVTMTVDNLSLIASSIMSKKLASGADVIVLDVKVGSGAFLKTIEEARALAKEMIAIGTSMGKKVKAILTNMDEPLGLAIGNSLEVEEAIATLKGNGPKDFTELIIHLATEMLQLVEPSCDARSRVEEALKKGKAYEKFLAFIKAQGATSLDFKKAKFVEPVLARESGYLQSTDAERIGRIATLLGAGRLRKEDPIDPSSGIVMHKKIGDSVREGEALCTLYTDNETVLEEATQTFFDSITIGDEKIGYHSIVIETI
ncbi:thymidine phosphorylase [Guggenheimella bovis]